MISDKIKTLEELVVIRENLRFQKKKVVFTNGVFDILHRGHVEYLEEARSLGDILILGLNSDTSVRMVKGQGRPLVPQDDRAALLAALESVSFVCLFDEETPAQIIAAIIPDILVKGSDYAVNQIVGHDVVMSNGGKVITIPLTPGKSTTNVIRKIIELSIKGILLK